MSGIYIHIPFCKQACSYCDFYFSTSLKHKDEVIGAMLQEMTLRHDYLPDKHVDTLYFGGGTPSILHEKELGSLIDRASSLYTISPQAEITLECNPDDLSDKTLQSLKHLGINRLSIGLQSFDDQELAWMNRAHTASESEASVKRAQDKGFENITIDLIYGSKFQTSASWKQTLQKASELGVAHISAYNLTIEAKTKLGHDYALRREPPVDDEKSSGLFLEMTEILERYGFIHYEISNFGKPGFFSRHNSNYWKGVHYIGIGPSAHSFDGHSRQWNISNNALYAKRISETDPSFFEKEILSDRDRFNEYLLTGLRTMWGVDEQVIRSTFGDDARKQFHKHVALYISLGQVQQKDGIFTLTKEGKLFADKIASELFIE